MQSSSPERLTATGQSAGPAPATQSPAIAGRLRLVGRPVGRGGSLTRRGRRWSGFRRKRSDRRGRRQDDRRRRLRLVVLGHGTTAPRRVPLPRHRRRRRPGGRRGYRLSTVGDVAPADRSVFAAYAHRTRPSQEGTCYRPDYEEGTGWTAEEATWTRTVDSDYCKSFRCRPHDGVRSYW